jgi:hypothetical protein
MPGRRHEIHLPLQFNDGTPIPDDAFRDTREQIVAQFGAVSVQPGTIAGIWLHQGTRYEDTLVRFCVDVDDTPENRQFFVNWKPALLQRFQQVEIYITSLAIDVI